MTTNSIPDFNALSASQIQEWIETNPANAAGIQEAKSALVRVTSGDVSGVGSAQPQIGSGIELPPPSSSGDMKGASEILAKFESLVIEMLILSAKNKKLARQDVAELLERAAQEMLAAADKKDEAADKIMSMAVAALVISIVGAVLSVILAPVSAATGGASKAAQQATQTAVKKTIKETVKKIIKQIMTKMKDLLSKGGSQAAKTVAKKIVRVLATPETTIALFRGVSDTMNSLGQSESMKIQAEGDRSSARATQAQSLQRKEEEYVGDFRETMRKMNEMIRTLLDAKIKAEEAAAKV